MKQVAMNVIDEAFIRAYQPEAMPASQSQAARVAPAAPRVAQSTPRADKRAVMASVAPDVAVAVAPNERAPYFFQVTSTDVAPDAVAPPVETTEVASPEVWKPVEDRAVEPSTPRQPLSSFVQPQRTVEAVFRPEFEVDAFRWPQTCLDLTTQWASSFSSVVDAVFAAVDGGRSLIGIAGLAEGVGATTLTLCLARLATQAGKSVVLVDGNFHNPMLATRLGLEVDSGWEQVLNGTTPLSSSVIYSQADRLALLPLLTGGLRASQQIDTIHASVTAGVLRYHYDLVLVDLGSVAGGGQTAVARKLAEQLRLDACLVTSDQLDQGQVAQLGTVAPELAKASLGVIENQTRLAAAS